jgi:hypothetical protein
MSYSPGAALPEAVAVSDSARLEVAFADENSLAVSSLRAAVCTARSLVFRVARELIWSW